MKYFRKICVFVGFENHLATAGFKDRRRSEMQSCRALQCPHVKTKEPSPLLTSGWLPCQKASRHSEQQQQPGGGLDPYAHELRKPCVDEWLCIFNSWLDTAGIVFNARVAGCDIWLLLFL